MADNNPNTISYRSCPRKGYRIAFTVINVAYGFVALGLIIVGIMHLKKQELNEYLKVLGVTEFRWYMMVVSFFCGFLILCSTVVGCVGIWLRNKQTHRPTLIAFLAIQTVLLVLGLVAVVMTLQYLTQTQTDEFEHAAANIKQFYGLKVNGSHAVDGGVTAAMNALQTKAKCCGWSAGDGKANIFEDTPWFRSHAFSEWEDAEEPQLYPESCCTDAALNSAEQLEECTKAKVEPDARFKGYIHFLDCVDKLSDKNEKYSWIALILTVASLLLLSAVSVFAFLLLIPGCSTCCRQSAQGNVPTGETQPDEVIELMQSGNPGPAQIAARKTL